MCVDFRLSDAADYPARCLPGIVLNSPFLPLRRDQYLTTFGNNVFEKIGRGLGKPTCLIWPFQRPKTARVRPLPTER